MCKFNSLCQALDGSCECSHFTKISPFMPISSVPQLPLPSINVLQMVYHQICQQNELIRSVKESLGNVLERLSSLHQPTVEDLSSTADLNTAVTTATQLRRYLCGEATHKYSFELMSEVVNPAYKERAFSLLLQLTDAGGNKVQLDKSIFCKIMLFTTENPPKVIKLNTVGDKILKGNTELHGNSNFIFRNIAIKEVSSHFRNGCFFLVAMPSNTTDVAPFIIENLIVKARRASFEESQARK